MAAMCYWCPPPPPPPPPPPITKHLPTPLREVGGGGGGGCYRILFLALHTKPQELGTKLMSMDGTTSSPNGPWLLTTRKRTLL